jgi:hypoxanthine phosphoribosyltransferase
MSSLTGSRSVEVLIDRERIARRVSELGAEISCAYANRELHLVGVLRGALPFLADLMRALSIQVTMDCLAIASYGASTRSTGVVRLLKDLEDSVAGRSVLLVEDIIDTGLTLQFLLKNLSERGVTDLEVCALLNKPSARRVPVSARYVGFEVPDVFVVGYGLDYDQRYRELPFVGVLRDSAQDGPPQPRCQ